MNRGFTLCDFQKARKKMYAKKFSSIRLEINGNKVLACFIHHQGIHISQHKRK
jgi:hypothetical protein